MHDQRLARALVVLLILIAAVRIPLADGSRPQGFDEPAHIVAGMEWLQRGTYQLDPLHPPLARIAIAVPLRLAGERIPGPDLNQTPDFWAVGNNILYRDGHYLRNLFLARCGIFPFFVLAAVVVFLWTRREFGALAAVIAAALFTTLPIVLAFSSLAYTDLPAASLQFAALFVWVTWLDKPTRRSSVLLGTAVGLAALAKFTTLLFLPAAVLAVMLCKWMASVGEREPGNSIKRRWLLHVAAVALIAAIVVWGGYRFSLGHIRETMQISTQSMPSFQHFPAPARDVARRAIASDWTVPAPALLRGLAVAWVFNGSAPPAYLFGKLKAGGWWYFFLVATAVKTPLSFLVLSVIGLYALFQCIRRVRWTQFVPAVAALAILAVTAAVNTNYGLRHVLVIFPLLAIVAGHGAATLWRLSGKSRAWGRWTLAALLAWQAVSTIRAQADSIAYFNELAGQDPSTILITGCDLDCGQDVFRLAQELRARHVTHVSIALWSSADLSQMGLPDFKILQPFQPATGWIAVGVRSMRMGDVLHSTYPSGAFGWLANYRPVATVGKTISLYYIPESPPL